ncbi:hypothetical protein CEE44_02530 [Candidatus Woesearchaeota archaeon B3_Woes]|nr:MAG: hypothetical protein CEE44_02530 [Candidatus Woesearchaeota archaeon B3_Woes]
MKNKKSQMAGQVFMYVLAMVVFSMTLLYGYKAINYFNDRSEEISYLQIESDIKNEVEKIEADSKGTIKKKVLTVPGNYDHICFVESYPSFPSAAISTQYPLINGHINNGAEDKNMFLAPPGDVSFYVGDIKVEDGADQEECVEVVNGKVTLKLESMGNHVWVSEWS